MKSRNFDQKFLSKIEILWKIENLVKNWKFGQKLKIRSKIAIWLNIEILVKNQNVGQKSNFGQKEKIGRKLKFWSKNFGQKPKFWFLRGMLDTAKNTINASHFSTKSDRKFLTKQKINNFNN